MHRVAQYRQFASDYRCLAAMLTKPADKQASELFAIGWDKVANKCEAMLRSEEQPNELDARSTMASREPELILASLMDQIKVPA